MSWRGAFELHAAIDAPLGASWRFKACYLGGQSYFIWPPWIPPLEYSEGSLETTKQHLHSSEIISTPVFLADLEVHRSSFTTWFSRKSQCVRRWPIRGPTTPSFVGCAKYTTLLVSKRATTSLSVRSSPIEYHHLAHLFTVRVHLRRSYLRFHSRTNAISFHWREVQGRLLAGRMVLPSRRSRENRHHPSPRHRHSTRLLVGLPGGPCSPTTLMLDVDNVTPSLSPGSVTMPSFSIVSTAISSSCSSSSPTSAPS